MRVGIDAWVLGSQIGGDETYLRNVIRGLGAVDGDSDYTLFVSPPLPRTQVPGAERMRRVVVWPRNPRVRLPVTFPLALARTQVDVLHVQYMAPLYPVRTVVTVHDIAYERYSVPEAHGYGDRGEEFELRKNFYRTLIDRCTPVWKSVPTNPMHAYTNPAIYLYDTRKLPKNVR